ncbi:MAG: hypothetical protein L0214_14790 [candidate division NC10 bacterium]|nr:hypothetical protein [candidate division NC10 bacterium]
MKERSEKPIHDGALALQTRRKFLKRALLTAAYVTPLIVSYPGTVFAAHCNNMTCGGGNHMAMGMTWSPGCSLLN